LTSIRAIPPGPIGKRYIASLVLPDEAERIKAGGGWNSDTQNYDSTFKRFTELTGIAGAGVKEVGGYAFMSCALSTVSFPAATNIGGASFQGTGPGSLTLTLGATPPALEGYMFHTVDAPKSVTLKVPAAALSAYGPSPTNTVAGNWGNGFRGGGWEGDALINSGNVNGNISLTIGADTAPQTPPPPFSGFTLHLLISVCQKSNRLYGQTLEAFPKLTEFWENLTNYPVYKSPVSP
jgi:hypothetical protein